VLSTGAGAGAAGAGDTYTVLAGVGDAGVVAGGAVVAAGGLGFGVTVTVWVMNGIGLAFGLAGVEPHAVRLIPAANTMAGIAISLLSFIVLPSPNDSPEPFSAMPRRASRSAVSTFPSGCWPLAARYSRLACTKFLSHCRNYLSFPAHTTH
jgi:hypothetical protein